MNQGCDKLYINLHYVYREIYSTYQLSDRRYPLALQRVIQNNIRKIFGKNKLSIFLK